MQQVFTYANELLRRRSVHSRASRSHERKDHIRCFSKPLKLLTYNVVPLSPKSGILEWVDDTQPFLDFLQDKGTKRRGAHSRYWEGEWSFQLCMEEMIKVSSAKHEEKRAAFDRICENFSPVFRYFFVELFGHDLQAWHTAKMAYTRTCAVSSIVGHMLGIGDRHANNILVHQKTGELVHIDFGIVFEQGHLLPTPETVPFRLTRDIVDGMGPLGTEGAFTAAAEETAQILRDNSDTLLTILSGVVSDPQYEWRKGASKARARQEEEDHDANPERDNVPRIESARLVQDQMDSLATKHTIARIKEKLQGYEEGTSSEQQSVEGQVQLLINCARDPDNLCAIWRGWAPWL
jgi:serine-protein kinase ATM